jgi:hypothetical protein
VWRSWLRPRFFEGAHQRSMWPSTIPSRLPLTGGRRDEWDSQLGGQGPTHIVFPTPAAPRARQRDRRSSKQASHSSQMRNQSPVLMPGSNRREAWKLAEPVCRLRRHF